VARQTVEISRDDGRQAVVTAGVEEGQTVVTDGQSRLQSGSRVAVNDGARVSTGQGIRTGG
jgi:multidrug efflux pump subunit AcrA (membrane-fusion protein)